jgi:hypothetical protein
MDNCGHGGAPMAKDFSLSKEELDRCMDLVKNPADFRE